MKRFLLEVSTNWCGEDNTYSAYAETEQELVDILSEKAYENFSDFGGFDMILEELFPEVEDVNVLTTFPLLLHRQIGFAPHTLDMQGRNGCMDG